LVSNAGNNSVTVDVRARVYQVSSSTAMPVGEMDWKELQLLPGQTIVESAEIEFPEVRTGTRFLIQWLEGESRVMGRTEALVFPTDLLSELKTLAPGATALGLFDPSNVLKPLLSTLELSFVDLDRDELEHFHGRLAILGPFNDQTQMGEGLARQVKFMARKGTRVLWIQPPAQTSLSTPLVPSFHTVSEGAGTVIVAQALLIRELKTRPQSQLNLVHLCRQACEPAPLSLSDTCAIP
jgi:hypothetical protein